MLPPEIAAAASNSIGAAGKIAQALPADAATNLLDAARQAFVDAMGVAIFFPIAIALVGAVLVTLFMPADHLAESPSDPKAEKRPLTSGHPAPATGKA